ncbi:hypothetical protein ACFLWU_05005 [Chloroflexota bacterium]
MVCRLSENVQVRKESWGLLFYSSARHKVCFVRSGEWLYPHYFDGTWTVDVLITDIARRLNTPAEIIERSIKKLTSHLTDSEMIVNGLC